MHLSRWKFSRRTLCHRSRIDSGRTKCQQGTTDDILYSREPYGSESLRTKRVRLDQVTSCCLQGEVESTPGRRVLGQVQVCSKKGTDVLPNEVKRNHSLRHSPIVLC